MAFFPSSVGDELNAIRYRQGVQSAVNTRLAGKNLSVLSARLSRYQNLYPWMNPDAQLSLAEFGLEPENPIAMRAAQASGQIFVDEAPGESRPSEHFADLGSVGQGVQALQGIDAPSPQQRIERASQRTPAEISRSAHLRTQPRFSRDDPSVAAITDSEFFDPRVGMLVRPESEEDRARFAGTLRRIARATNIKIGTPYLDPTDETIKLLPAKGKPIRAVDAIPSTTGIERRRPSDIGFEEFAVNPARQQSLLIGGQPTNTAERSLSQMSIVEQSALLSARRGIPEGGGFGLAEVGRRAIQAGGIIMNAPAQAFAGQLRNIVEDFKGLPSDIAGIARGESPDLDFSKFNEAQSDLGIILENNNLGLEDAGHGFFVRENTALALERRNRELQRGTIHGKAITPGRLFADIFYNDDTTGFDILSGAGDAAFVVATDPVGIGLGKIAKARKFAKLFVDEPEPFLNIAQRALVRPHQRQLGEFGAEGIGLLSGFRNTYSPHIADSWLRGAGQPVINRFAQETNSRAIYNSLGRSDPFLATRIADESNPQAVADILRGRLGMSIREKPQLSSFQPESRFSASSIFAELPGRRMNLNSPRDIVDQTEKVMRNFKASPAELDEAFDIMARVSNEPMAARNAFIKDIVGKRLRTMAARRGVKPERIDELTDLYQRQFRQAEAFFIDQVGNPRNPWANHLVTGAGDIVDAPSPHLAIEHAQWLPLPEAREVQRSLSRFNKWELLERKAGLQIPRRLADSAVDNIWKPGILLRAAWPIRVIAEEQFRMAAAGYANTISHPIHALGWIIGRNEGLADDVLDATDEGLEALSRGTGQLRNRPDTKFKSTGLFDVVSSRTASTSDRLRGWHEEIAQLHTDTASRIIARAPDQATAREEFFSGSARHVRERLFRADKARREGLNSRLGSDFYTDSIIERQAIKSGRNDDIMEAIRTGRLDGQPILKPGTRQLNPKFQSALRKRSEFMPEFVKVSRIDEVRRYSSMWDEIVEFGFTALMSKPTNKLSRSPVFRQAYWQRVEELVGFASPADQQKIIQRAEQALGRGAFAADPKIQRQLARIRERAAASSGDADLTTIDEFSKAFGLDTTRDLLYDLNRRSKFFEQTRLMFPFGNAFQEVVSRWANLITENPRIIRRAQQGLEGVTSEGAGQVLGAPTGEGFFWENERGEMVFTYPGSQLLTSFLTKVPIPLTGRAQGLNMVGEVMPGFGPMVQIPAAWLTEHVPLPRVVEDQIFPFGMPQGDFTDPTTWSKEIFPRWMQRALGAFNEGGDNPNNVQSYNASVMAVATYLSSQRDDDGNLLYRTRGPGVTEESARKEMTRLMNAARSRAKSFSVVRGMAQFILPASPAPDWLINTKNDGLVRSAILANDLRSMREEDYQTADTRFLEKWGDEPFLLLQGRTQGVSFGYPTTRAGEEWVRNNPQVRDQLPFTFGFFAPKQGDFDYTAYLRSINRGDAKPLTPDQFLMLGHARLAGIQFRKAQEMLWEASDGRPNQQQQAWLGEVREALDQEYPGYFESREGGLGLVERASSKIIMQEMERALTLPDVKDTDAGKGLAKYMQGRQQIIAEATRREIKGWQSAFSTRDLRSWLRNLATVIINEHPDFLDLWEQGLERELRSLTQDTFQEEAE